MRDLIFLAYIAAWVGLACFVKRIPFWQPRVLRHGDLSIIPDQRPAGCMMVLFLGMGAMIGATLPMSISDWLPRNPYQWRTGSTEDLGLLGRAAMLVGGFCGAYVGFRGSWLWVVLFLIGGAFYVVLSSAKWVVWGGF